MILLICLVRPYTACASTLFRKPVDNRRNRPGWSPSQTQSGRIADSLHLDLLSSALCSSEPCSQRGTSLWPDVLNWQLSPRGTAAKGLPERLALSNGRRRRSIAFIFYSHLGVLDSGSPASHLTQYYELISRARTAKTCCGPAWIHRDCYFTASTI